MKLLQLNNRYYLTAFACLLLLNFVLLFFLINYFVNNYVDKSLTRSMAVVLSKIEAHDTLPLFMAFSENELEIKKVATAQKEIPSFSNIDIFSAGAGENISYRQMISYATNGSGNYEVILRRALIPSRELFKSIIITGFLTITLVFLILGWLQGWISRRLWSPFYVTLEKLKRFELNKGAKVSFDEEQIEEFRALNHALNSLTEKVFQDYKGQKQFVENASHELQTPLSVIKTKLELLVQSERLQEDEMKLLASALVSVTKLSRTIKALILLSKIENRQFRSEVKVDIERKCREMLEDFSESISAKGIKLNLISEGACIVKMNEELAEVLLANLIKNAVKHNVENGSLHITFRNRELVMENSGIPPEVPVEKLFQRFYSKSNSEDSIGLGLPIIEHICMRNNFHIHYSYQDKIHKLTIRF